MAKRTTGWYPDPKDASKERYWDGEQWHGKRKVKDPDSGTSFEDDQPSPKPLEALLGNLRDAWNGLNKWVRVGIAIAVLLIIIATIYNMQKSPYQDYCESQAATYGFRGDEVEPMVESCVKLSEMMGRPS